MGNQKSHPKINYTYEPPVERYLSLNTQNYTDFEKQMKLNLINITELDFSLQKNDHSKMFEYCKQIPNLKMLHFKNCSLEDDKIDQFISLIKEKKLSYLNLMNNKITQVGAKKLFDSLAQNDTLEILNLMFNQIKNEDTLFDFLKQNYTLCILGITGNELSLSTKENLLENLHFNHTLNNILMDNNHPESQHVVNTIREILVENKTKKPIKLLILLLRREKKSILSILPRRLVIYLLKFI